MMLTLKNKNYKKKFPHNTVHSLRPRLEKIASEPVLEYNEKYASWFHRFLFWCLRRSKVLDWKIEYIDNVTFGPIEGGDLIEAIGEAIYSTMDVFDTRRSDLFVVMGYDVLNELVSNRLTDRSLLTGPIDYEVGPIREGYTLRNLDVSKIDIPISAETESVVFSRNEADPYMIGIYKIYDVPIHIVPWLNGWYVDVQSKYIQYKYEAIKKHKITDAMREDFGNINEALSLNIAYYGEENIAYYGEEENERYKT